MITNVKWEPHGEDHADLHIDCDGPGDFRDTCDRAGAQKLLNAARDILRWCEFKTGPRCVRCGQTVAQLGEAGMHGGLVGYTRPVDQMLVAKIKIYLCVKCDKAYLEGN